MKISCALIMCGGKCSRFGSDKSLLEYKGEKMISYVLKTLKECGIKRVVLIANQDNYNLIREQVIKIYKDFTLIKNNSKSFREGISHVENSLDENFLLVAGNQPLHKKTIKRILKTAEKTGKWVTSLYPKEISNEEVFVSLLADKLVWGDKYVLQHPLVISKEIIGLQKDENFSNKLERTIFNQLNSKDIYGILAEMPPEFDDSIMLERNKKFINSIRSMDLILLPGNSISNKEWTSKVEKELGNLFDSTKINFYEHWKTGEPAININKEVEKLSALPRENKEFLIFAKSAGCLVTLKALYENKIFPKKCFFVGFPYSWAKNMGFDFDIWFNSTKVPTVFIQNKEDPFMNSADLKKYLLESELQNYKIYEIEGNTHDYENLIRIKNIVEENNG